MSYTPTPADYKLIFEDHKVGAAILEQMVARFARDTVITEGGIDAVLKTYQKSGQRQVLDFILMQVSRANGAPDPNADNQE